MKRETKPTLFLQSCSIL
jgi:hypothetical protein